jgi:hypothetical protein
MQKQFILICGLIASLLTGCGGSFTETPKAQDTTPIQVPTNPLPADERN